MMMDIKIVEADFIDRDFIVYANNEIDVCSYIASSKLSQNISDVLNEKKGICLLAKDGAENVGMVLFSKVYWADRGQGIYLSQGYVSPQYRKKGVFKLLLKNAFDYFEDIEFMTCLVSKKNSDMIECMNNLSFEDEQMISYVKNKDDFYKMLKN